MTPTGLDLFLYLCVVFAPALLTVVIGWFIDEDERTKE